MRLYLDVDGVINPWSAADLRDLPWPDYDAYQINGYTLRLSPQLGAALAALPVELVWATTWVKHPAGLAEIAEIMGLPCDKMTGFTERWWVNHPSPSETCGKLEHIQAMHDDEPFVWVDDQQGRLDYNWAHSNGGICATPVDHLGITPKLVEEITRWFDDVSRTIGA